MTRILIVDDHSVVRKGLRQILSETSGMIVGGEAATAEKAIEMVSRESFDVIILDLAMPGRGGLEVIRELTTLKSSPKVLVLSIHAEDQYALHCLRNGAAGYLSKASSLAELVQAVQKVAEGGKYISHELVERLALSSTVDSTHLPHESLSNRELQILVLFGSGRTVIEISRELSLSSKTISTYRSRILQKMGLERNAQLVRYAIKQGLVE
jgi:two-component system, NarL family, invasion response regulator UvrY